MTEEIKEMVRGINVAFEQFKTENDKRLDEIAAGKDDVILREKVDRINDDITAIKQDMKKVRVAQSAPSGRDAQHDPDEREKRQFEHKTFMRHVRQGPLASYSDEEKVCLRALSDGDGSFTVPPDFSNRIIIAAYDLAEIRPYCNVSTTGRDTVHFPGVTKPTTAWGRPNTAITPQTLAADTRIMEIMDLRSIYKIPNNTLNDALADVEMEIEMGTSLAIAEAEDDAFIVGDGSNEPQGILTNSSVQANYVASGVAAAISDSSNNGIDAMTEIFYKPKKTYRRNGTWAMNSSTEADVRKLKDSDGQYLWQPSVQADRPATLLGRPVINPEGAPDVAANAFPIVFGDFRQGYAIRDNGGLTMKRLDELYAATDQTGLLMKKRTGGIVLLAEAFACMKIATS